MIPMSAEATSMTPPGPRFALAMVSAERRSAGLGAGAG